MPAAGSVAAAPGAGGGGGGGAGAAPKEEEKKAEEESEDEVRPTAVIRLLRGRRSLATDFLWWRIRTVVCVHVIERFSSDCPRKLESASPYSVLSGLLCTINMLHMPPVR
jgi:hypothetical protein